MPKTMSLVLLSIANYVLSHDDIISATNTASENNRCSSVQMEKRWKKSFKTRKFSYLKFYLYSFYFLALHRILKKLSKRNSKKSSQLSENRQIRKISLDLILTTLKKKRKKENFVFRLITIKDFKSIQKQKIIRKY